MIGYDLNKNYHQNKRFKPQKENEDEEKEKEMIKEKLSISIRWQHNISRVFQYYQIASLPSFMEKIDLIASIPSRFFFL